MNLPTDNITEFEDYCRLLVDYKQWYEKMGKDPSNGNASFRRIVSPITGKLRLFNQILAHIGWEIVVRKKQ
jgi:hypothetical protein